MRDREPDFVYRLDQGKFVGDFINRGSRIGDTTRDVSFFKKENTAVSILVHELRKLSLNPNASRWSAFHSQSVRKYQLVR